MHEPGVARPDRNGLRVAEPNEFDAGNVDGPDGGIEAMNAVESRSRTSEGRPQTGSQLVAIHGRTWPPGQPGRLRGKSKTETRRADPHRGPTRPKVPDSDGVIYANRPGAAAADPTSPTPPGSRLAAAGLLRPADQCARHRAPSHQPRLRVRDDRHDRPRRRSEVLNVMLRDNKRRAQPLLPPGDRSCMQPRRRR
jgi:hypothetical protein